MIEVKVDGKTPNEVVEIVVELKKQGYKLDIDFNFAYYQPKYDDNGYTLMYDRHTIFTFYRDELATWFSLRYL